MSVWLVRDSTQYSAVAPGSHRRQCVHRHHTQRGRRIVRVGPPRTHPTGTSSVLGMCPVPLPDAATITPPVGFRHPTSAGHRDSVAGFATCVRLRKTRQFFRYDDFVGHWCPCRRRTSEPCCRGWRRRRSTPTRRAPDPPLVGTSLWNRSRRAVSALLLSVVVTVILYNRDRPQSGCRNVPEEITISGLSTSPNMARRASTHWTSPGSPSPGLSIRVGTDGIRSRFPAKPPPSPDFLDPGNHPAGGESRRQRSGGGLRLPDRRPCGEESIDRPG